MDTINKGMKTSLFGLEFISKWEGCILKPYIDAAGLRTIGIGHLIKPKDNFPDNIEISMKTALDLLSQDVKFCEDSIASRIKVSLNQNQFYALVSFGFNCGTGVYALSDACKTLNKGEYHLVPEKLLQWNKIRIHGVLQVNAGLNNRRKSEGQLFIKSSIKSIPWTRNTLIEVQTRLTALGLYTIKIDGLWGPATLAALIKFSENAKINTVANLESEISETLLEAIKKS